MIWSQEEKDYLAKVVKNTPYKEVQELMCIKFKKQYTFMQVQGAIKRYRLKNGIVGGGKFPKGNIPYNKGKKMEYNAASASTQFKKGDVPLNLRPIGAERTNTDGYTMVKVNHTKWVLKHRLMWENANGKIPKGKILIFLDGNKSNTDLENLTLISRHELLTLNRNKLIFENKETTQSGLLVSKLIIKSQEVNRCKS